MAEITDHLAHRRGTVRIALVGSVSLTAGLWEARLKFALDVDGKAERLDQTQRARADRLGLEATHQMIERSLRALDDQIDYRLAEHEHHTKDQTRVRHLTKEGKTDE